MQLKSNEKRVVDKLLRLSFFFFNFRTDNVVIYFKIL
jgi:hypothetical protein